MPTAVERLANLLGRMLRLDVGDGSVDQARFDRLDHQVDAGMAALESAANSRQFATVERRYGHVFEQLGAGAYEIGAHLQFDASVFNSVNQLLGGADVLFGDGGGAGRPVAFGDGGGAGRPIGFGDGGGAGRPVLFGDGGGAGVPVASGDGGGAGIQADFAKFDRQLSGAGADLKTFGADLARLGHVASHDALMAVERGIVGDLRHLQSDFSALSGEIATLGRDLQFGDGGGAGTVESGDGGGAGAGAIAKLLSAMSPLAGEFSKIGVDFGALADDFTGAGGGSGIPAGGLTVTSGDGGGAGMPMGAAFSALQHDFATLSSSLQGLGTPIAGLLLPGAGANPAA